MAKMVGDLEIDQELEHTKKEWKIERISWVIMLLLLIAALLGLLGPGPLSKATRKSSGDEIELKYNRFIRYIAPTQLELTLSPNQGEQAQFWINNQFLEDNRIEGIIPEPQSVQSGSDRTVYQIETSGADKAIVIVRLKNEKIGTVKGEIGLVNGPSLNFTQFAYP